MSHAPARHAEGPSGGTAATDGRPGDPHPVPAPEALPGAACLREALDVRLRPPKGRQDGGSGQSSDPGGVAEWPQVAAAPLRLCRALVSTRRRIWCGPTSSSTRRTSGGTRYLEGELACLLPNGAIIKLYGGAAAYERMRGMYFDGIVLDEYPLLNPAVFGTVVRPCLADYDGFALVSGTSNGDDHFNHLRLRTESDPRWDQFIIPLSSTGEEALSKEEAIELAQDMTPEEYSRELECSFDAPVEGAYYAEALNKLQPAGPDLRRPPGPLSAGHHRLGLRDSRLLLHLVLSDCRAGDSFHRLPPGQWEGVGPLRPRASQPGP